MRPQRGSWARSDVRRARHLWREGTCPGPGEEPHTPPPQAFGEGSTVAHGLQERRVPNTARSGNSTRRVAPRPHTCGRVRAPEYTSEGTMKRLWIFAVALLLASQAQPLHAETQT